MQTKICSKCSIEKEVTKFTKSRKDNSGFHSYCNSCRNEIQKLRRKTNKEKFSELDLRYKNKYPWRRIWNYINPRCNNPKNSFYKSYGDRGIQNLFKNWDEIKEIMVTKSNKTIEELVLEMTPSNRDSKRKGEEFMKTLKEKLK